MTPELASLPGLVTTSEASALGIGPDRLARGPFQRVRHGVYVPTGTPLGDVDARIVVAAASRPDGVVIGGWAAARLHERSVARSPEPIVVFDGTLPGAGVSRSPLPVLVCTPRSTRLRRTSGITIMRSDADVQERAVLEGVPVTSAVRSAFDIVRLWPPTAGVVALDRLRNLGLVAGTDLAEVLSRRAGWRGVGRARRVLELSDAGSESPRETIMRLLWMQTGLVRPRANPVVRTLDGRFVARVDLIDPDAGVVGEYDGAFHATARRRSEDAARQERLEDLGLVVIRANDPDLATDLGRRTWQMRLRRVHARATTRPARSRPWLLTDT
jgi:hypothetical protein